MNCNSFISYCISNETNYIIPFLRYLVYKFLFAVEAKRKNRKYHRQCQPNYSDDNNCFDRVNPLIFFIQYKYLFQ